MARLFPLRTETPAREGTPRVVDLDGEDADAVFGALSSNTARRIYARLDEEPGTPSDLAEAIDSSIQNVRYHLEKLEDAGLIEVVDTWYSSRGNEMSVYATANGPLIVTSDQSRAAQLKEALSRFVGGVGILGVASLFVQAAAQRFGAVGIGGDDAAGADSAGEDVSSGDSAGDDVAGDDAAGDDAADSEAADGDAETTGLSTEYESVESEAVEEDATVDEDGSGTSGDDATLDDAAAPDSGEESTGAIDVVSDGIAATLDGFASWLSPGLAFFIGGLAVLTAILCWWYWATYRPGQI